MATIRRFYFLKFDFSTCDVHIGPSSYYQQLSICIICRHS